MVRPCASRGIKQVNSTLRSRSYGTARRGAAETTEPIRGLDPYVSTRGSPVNPISIVASVLAKARKYRKLTRMIDDRETARRILELIEELKQRAVAVAKPDEEHIRVRAGNSGTKMAVPPGETRNFGIRPNGNCAKPKNSQNTRAKIPEMNSPASWLAGRILRCSQQIRDDAVLSLFLCQQSENLLTLLWRLRHSELLSVHCQF